MRRCGNSSGRVGLSVSRVLALTFEYFDLKTISFLISGFRATFGHIWETLKDSARVKISGYKTSLLLTTLSIS